MIPELGHVALILALQLALLQSLLCLAGAARGHTAWMRMGAGAVHGQALLVVLGFAALVWAYVANDFSVLNVAEHSSRQLPLVYRMTAAWGSHEGSMLLWTLILGGWSVALVHGSRDVPAPLRARALGVLGCISVGLLAFILFTSNPFLRIDPPAPDGMDLNPLLQDPGMVAHPPLLYMGYVGFSVAFGFAIAALLHQPFEAAWARWALGWTRVAWAFLTLGIAVGSWWAYYELGWGGWWFWDPTENASLMPWLVGTALLHALGRSVRQGSLQTWSIFLAIVAFSLCLLGTFLVRSGVLSSVHAFAQDPTRGLFILLYLLLVIGGSLALFAVRGWRLASATRPEPYTTADVLVLLGNVLLLVAMGAVLLGTLYPLLLDALNLGKVSVGPPYFNAVFVPLMVPVLLLAALGAHLGGRVQGVLTLLRSLRWVLLGAVLVALALVALALPRWSWAAALGLALAAWIAGAGVAAVLRAWRTLGSIPWALLGVSLAHGGLALGLVGVALVSAYEQEADVAMAPGDTVALAGYRLEFKGAREVPGPNYSAVVAELALSRDQRPLGTLAPEKRIYHSSRKQMSEAAIRYGVTGDVYAALGDPLKDGAWTVKVYHKPFVLWIWLGAGVMALGAALAALRGTSVRSAT